jgi:hypothetical protein
MNDLQPMPLFEPKADPTEYKRSMDTVDSTF